MSLQPICIRGPLPCEARASWTPCSVYRSTSSIHATHRVVRFRGLVLSCCRAIVPVGRSKHLQVVAFRDAKDAQAGSPVQPSRVMSVSEHVSISVDYYRLLQVPHVSRPDAIRKAYENLVKQPPATAYSADTLFARAVLLKAAAESLIDPDLRRSYDAKLAAGYSTLRVSQQDLPGTLVVLQEIGEFQLVLDHGIRWLEVNGSQPDAGDVAAAMALAYCDRAGERLAAPSNKGAVLPACDDLDAALVKLRRYSMAKQLQTQIVGALRDLAPEYACELAALPLGPDTSARRAKGVALMRGVLRSAAAAAATAGSRSGVTDADSCDLLGSDADLHSVVIHARRMLQRGRDVLTCGEQVALLPDALHGSGIMPHPDVLYDGALACIVDGYRNGWPHSVHQADLLLQQLEDFVRRQFAAQLEKQKMTVATAAPQAQDSDSAAAAAAVAMSTGHRHETSSGGAAEGSHGGTVALERAVCAVLLGDYASAAALLGLTDSEASGTCEAAVPAAEAQLRSFVMEHAPPGTKDMRPGLRALTTKWMEGVALQSFRDTVGQPAVPLDNHWFADPRVAVYLQVWRMCRNNSEILAAAHFICNLLPNMLKVFSAFGEKAAAVLALAASRVQQVGTALLSFAAASVFAKQRREQRIIPINRASARQLGNTNVSSARAPPAAAAAVPAVGPAVSAVGTSTAAPNRPPKASTPSPFGHPYGTTLHSGSVEHSRRPAAPTEDTGYATTIASAPQGGVSPAVVNTAAAGAVAASGVAVTAVPSTDLRRRFAANAAGVAELDASAQLGLDFRDGEDDDGHHIDDTVLPNDNLDLNESTSARRRGMTEQDLRAHLAGLEAAMWDSEVPRSGLSPQRLIFLLVSVAAVLGTLLFFILKRNVVTCTPTMVPAVAPIAGSSFARPN